MSFIQELKTLKDHILSWLLSFVIISFAIFAVGLQNVQIFGFDILLPAFSQNSLAAIFFDLIKNDLLPEGVKLVATSPLAAFVSEIKISVFLGFILTFPFLVLKISGYLSPALFDGEKRVITRILLPSVALFFSGALFSYFLVIPETFRVLYSFNAVLGAEPFFSVGEFVGWVFVMMFTVGVMFLLPVFMYLLRLLGVISSDFWKVNWRPAFAVFLVVSAIITPDGSGVTMVLLSAPMMALYCLGAGISALSSSGSRRKPQGGITGLKKKYTHERI